jgi:hypothetical protein
MREPISVSRGREGERDEEVGMGRRISVAAMVGAAVLLVAAPASAKGIRTANFTGPGLPPGGVTIAGERPQLFQTGIGDQVRSYWSPFQMHISRAELGPAYRVTFRLDRFVGRNWRLHQTLYPYAKDGVWSYTPSGQTWGRHGPRLSPGWYSSENPQLLRFLVKHGFPRTAPVVAASPVASESYSSVTRGMVWGIVGFALMLGLLGLSARLRRMRR